MGHLDPARITTALCLLLRLQRCWEQEWGRRKVIQATRTQMNTNLSLSLVTKCLEWFWTWERIWSLVCVLEWSLELLYWMQMAENLDALNGGGWGYLYPQPSNQPLGLGCCRWAHRTVRYATGHSPVRQTRHPTVRVLTVSTVGALTSWCTGQSGASPDRHCSLSGAPLVSALTSAANCSSVRALFSRPFVTPGF
jgi:hypothetical protein